VRVVAATKAAEACHVGHEIVTRRQAIERGLVRFLTGRPCRHGHLAERYTSGACTECCRGRRRWLTEGRGEIYFLECGDFVKIGFASVLEGRLRSLRTANPYPLNILATISGYASTEKRLHARFAGARHRGEWFCRTPELLKFINEINGAERAA
jgi:hypothetical protein